MACGLNFILHHYNARVNGKPAISNAWTHYATQQQLSPTSWCIHPRGAMIGIHGQSYSHTLNYPSHYNMRGQGSYQGLLFSVLIRAGGTGCVWRVRRGCLLLTESQVSVSGLGQGGWAYSTNPMFVWHQHWSLNPDCCLTISSQLVCQPANPLYPTPITYTHTHPRTKTPAVGLSCLCPRCGVSVCVCVNTYMHLCTHRWPKWE